MGAAGGGDDGSTCGGGDGGLAVVPGVGARFVAAVATGGRST